MHFHDRIDAGQQLANKLAELYPDEDGVIYPLPRGGLPLGIEIAKKLHLPIDLIIPRKIGHPYNPEYAICAVSEGGQLVCNEQERSNVDPSWLQREVEAQQQESKRRHEKYLAGKKSLSVDGKTAFIVDDGIATGLTMLAAIKDAQARNASKIVVAIPVVPKDTYQKLQQQVDDVVALSVDAHYLGAVGAYYEHFGQVSDSEVIEMLKSL